MIYTKLETASKVGKKTMLKWDKKGKILTLEDLLRKDHSNSYRSSKTTQKLQGQPPNASAIKVRCNGRCPSAKLRTNTHLKQKRGRNRDRIDTLC
mgnify:CR=1 FL=1